jgi:transcriptional regulator with XRE-family HTH domain
MGQVPAGRHVVDLLLGHIGEQFVPMEGGPCLVVLHVGSASATGRVTWPPRRLSGQDLRGGMVARTWSPSSHSGPASVGWPTFHDSRNVDSTLVRSTAGGRPPILSGTGARMPSKKKQIRHAEVVRLFAARLRERRLGNGLTQAGLAEAAGVTPTYITRLEAAGAAPGIDTVAQLANALGTTLHDLLPLTAPPDVTEHLRGRWEAVCRQVGAKADRDLLNALVPLLARLSEVPAKGR